MTWEDIIKLIKFDAEEKGAIVDFLDQKDSVDSTVYVYFKDDDISAVFALNDQHRVQLVNTINETQTQISGPIEQMKGQFASQVADVFWSELNEHYCMTN